MITSHEERRISGVALLLLVLQPLLFYRRVLFNPRSHIPFDIEAFHLPLASYIARCIREGVFPFWNPYPYCGVPIHADIQAQLFYPFTWISLLLGNLSSGHKLFYWIEWLVPLHMALAGLFTFFLLRQLRVDVPSALFGGTVYQLSGFFASQAQHLGAICCGAWLPFMMLCVLKLKVRIDARWIALLAVGTSLTVLAGFPATTLVTYGAVGLLIVGLVLSRATSWKFFAAIGGGFALGQAIAAVQIIPTYQLARLSVAALRYQWTQNGGGLRIQSLGSLIVPNYYHIFTPFDSSPYKLNINFTLLYVYCGMATVALVTIAPFLRNAQNARKFFFFTVLSALWMLGDSTPVYPLVYLHLPRLLKSALYAEYALLAFCMFAALTAAVSLSHVLASSPKGVLWAIAFLTTVDLIHFGANRPMNSLPANYKTENSEYEIHGYTGSLSKIQTLVNANPPLRIDYLDTDGWTFTWGSEMLKLPTADGYNPLMLKRIYTLRRLFSGANPWEKELPVTRPDSPLISMLNTGFLAGHSGGSPDQMRHAGAPLAADIAGFRFYRILNPLPRFFFVRRLHISNSPEETFSYLARSDFAPSEEAVVEADDLPPDERLASGTVNVERYSPNRIELSVVTNDRAFLASSEVLYPGWTASTNGKPARLYMTDGAFRGLILGPGTNRVVMTYWPAGFLMWAAISIVSLLLTIAGLIFGGARTDGQFSAHKWSELRG